MRMSEYVKSEIEQRRAALKNGHTEKSQARTNGDTPQTNGHAEDTEMKDADNQNGSEPAKSVVEEPHEKQDAPDMEQERVDISNFSLALNPDVCSGQAPPTDEDKEQYAEDEKEVRAVCTYLRSKIIPDLIQDLYDSDVGFPMDGRSLSQLLHKRGINVRYLGKVAMLAAEKGRRLQALVTLAIQEMVARAFKHISNRYLGHLPAPFATSCISHLLNCLLGTDLNPMPRPEMDEDLRELYPEGDFAFVNVTPSALKADVESQIKARYRYSLPDDWQSSLKPLQALREIALKQGLQMSAKDYVFSKEKESRGDESPVRSKS